MCIDQKHLESIFELELMFNTYRAVMSNPYTSDEFKQFSIKSFEELEPSIQKYLEQMRSFRQPQVEK